MSIDRRKFLKSSLLATTGALASPYIISSPVRAAGTVDVGVLFSLTGGLSIIEKSLHDATLMAISEINASGGVKGMKINAVVEDGASDPKTYNEKASKLVIQDRVPTVFGSYTSASRKAVLPVFEKRNNLYFYPTYYEGFECSKNVVYTGAVPNQQLSNFIPWIIKTLGKKKFFIVGSNYIYPREMAKVSKILIEKNGGEWIADEYLELGHSEWGSMVNKIKGSGCDVVLSNVVGDFVVAFYREYKNQGLTHDKLPICATVTSEIEIAAMGPEYAVGSFTSFPYFQAIDTDRNKAFVERYRAFVKDPKAVTHHALEFILLPGVLVEAGGREGHGNHACRHQGSGEGTGVRRAERPCEDRSGQSAHLPDAPDCAVAAGRTGQDHRRLQGADHPAALRGLWRDREQPVLYRQGARYVEAEDLSWHQYRLPRLEARQTTRWGYPECSKFCLSA